MKDVATLLELLELEQLEVNLFRGQSTSVGSNRVFGGQVLAQSLHAAIHTTPKDRMVHSLHAYFVLPGDVNAPIVFEVDRVRDGGSFTTRRVKAIQHGKAIFDLSASFQLQQKGYDHQVDMPSVPPPEELANWEGLAREYRSELPPNMKRFLDMDRPIEFKPVERYNPASATSRPPFRHVWMRARGEMPSQQHIHQLVLAYTSDYNLLTTALLPHGLAGSFGKLQLASIDHAMWFHRDFRADEWLLYALDSPSAGNARGFTRGSIFSRDGKLVASVAQEGLMRIKEERG